MAKQHPCGYDSQYGDSRAAVRPGHPPRAPLWVAHVKGLSRYYKAVADAMYGTRGDRPEPWHLASLAVLAKTYMEAPEDNPVEELLGHGMARIHKRFWRDEAWTIFQNSLSRSAARGDG